MNATTLEGSTPAFASPKIERWSSEKPLFVCVVLAALAIWALLAVSIIGVIYALMIAVFLFFSHVIFIAHIRGSGVRLGPEQFPDLWERVVTLSRAAGMKDPPEAYVVQAGGSLNAFATKLFRGRMIVLFAELLDACGDDDAARDMVIGHELGHLKLGHLDWFWLTAPGRFMPFLGQAYSRACEFSCDRWGATLCGDRGGAMRGLAILAAGGARGAKVNLQAFVAQRQALDTGWMTLGCWLSNYPPLSARIEAIDPTLGRGIPYSTNGPLRAAFILSAFVIVPWLISMAAFTLWMATLQSLTNVSSTPSSYSNAYETETEPGDDDDSEYANLGVPRGSSDQERDLLARTELAALAEVVRAHHAKTGDVVYDEDELETAWHEQRGEETDPPLDPFDGYAYGLEASDAGVRLYSSGPDAEPDTDDDISVDVSL